MKMTDEERLVRISTERFVKRFWLKADRSGGPEACWIWEYSPDSSGYGQQLVKKGCVLRAHRIAWELHHQQAIPEGLVVKHLCDNRACVNPLHLDVDTNKGNVADRVARGRSASPKNQVNRRTSGTPAQRFERRVKKSRGNGCWLWAGYKKHSGYGLFKVNLVHVQAHRFAWELAHGEPVPEDKCVLHECDNRLCVRPSHLKLGDRKQNSADMVARGRSAKGDRNGLRKHPDRVPCGDLHPFKMNPELAARGEKHGSKTHPERWVRGDAHWSRTNPEKRATGDRHGSKTHPEAVKRGEDCSLAVLTEEKVRAIRQEYASGNLSQAALGVKYGISQTQVGRLVRGKRWGHVK